MPEYEVKSTSIDAVDTDRYQLVANLTLGVYTDTEAEDEDDGVAVSCEIDCPNPDIYDGLTVVEISHTISSLLLYHLSNIPVEMQASAKVTILSNLFQQLASFKPMDDEPPQKE